MQILFTSTGGLGHFLPLVPTALAARAAGHRVEFACPAQLRSRVEALGFRHVEAGSVSPDDEAVIEHHRSVQAVRPQDRRELHISRMFAGIFAPRMTADLMRVLASDPPDVLVRESLEFGGLVFAEALGVPHATVEVGALFPLQQYGPALAERLDRLRAEHGLPPDPELAALYRYLHLSFVPPSYQEPDVPPPLTARALRPSSPDGTGEVAPPWLAELGARTTVYATLGTEIPRRGIEAYYPGPFLAMLEAFHDEPVNVILTLGRDKDPAVFGHPPANARVEPFVPQSLVLPRCDLVVTHGGHGTVMAALALGLPMVIVPFMADQPYNAVRCTRLGVARVIEPSDLTPERLREEAREVLRTPSYRENARRVRSEIEALPPVAWAVELLEALSEGRPLPTVRSSAEGVGRPGRVPRA